MLAEFLELKPMSAAQDGTIIASLEIPSSTNDDEWIICGHAEIPISESFINAVEVIFNDNFVEEVELEQPQDGEAIRAEEDYMAQAILLYIPRITRRPIAHRVTFSIETQGSSRRVTLTR